MKQGNGYARKAREGERQTQSRKWSGMESQNCTIVTLTYSALNSGNTIVERIIPSHYTQYSKNKCKGNRKLENTGKDGLLNNSEY